tara:strand:- start:2732 stop:3067 length:336 start_codon:yes stop_codon:yes gene_type:complete
MLKFLKVTVGGDDNLIPIDQIFTAKVGADTEVIIYTHNVGFNGTASLAEALGYKITATTAADAAKTLEQLNAFVDLIGQASATSWTNPIFDITDKLPYAATAFARVELAWD